MGEQPLPPYGACLLGSWNLVKFIKDGVFDYEALSEDLKYVVRAMDNVIDRTIYPLKEQELEAKSKRRMGLGVTGLANAGEILGYTYGSDEFMKWMEELFAFIAKETYIQSCLLAKEKGSFPAFDKESFLKSNFVKTLPAEIQNLIKENGIRNSHLLSIAPTGTISLTADNISSGLEPVFSHFYDRTIQTFEGPKVERVEDYAYRVYGIKGKTANELSVFDHVKVLVLASKYVDSACSKTCNVGDDITWDQFKQVYMDAYEGGASGCTTFRASGKRYGILNASAVEDVAVELEKPKDDFINETEGGACYFDPVTGQKECS